ncbi:hypothetical protein GMI70_01390 [Eggerthellaceae bacterium zg-893]|nr:hypothetical protein [Eggerthellaceae bacterium zg-893]
MKKIRKTTFAAAAVAMALALGTVAGCAAETTSASDDAPDSSQTEAAQEDVADDQAQQEAPEAGVPVGDEDGAADADAVEGETDGESVASDLEDAETQDTADVEAVEADAASAGVSYAQVVSVDGTLATLQYGELTEPEEEGRGWGFVPEDGSFVVDLNSVSIANAQTLAVGDVVTVGGTGATEDTDAGDMVLEVVNL